MIFKKLYLTGLTLLLLLSGTKASFAETVMEKVSRTGVLTVGVNVNLVPYSYVNDKGELDGFSLNIVNLVKAELEKQTGKPIALEIVEADSVADRIPKILTGEIDISCDTPFTWRRDKYVDFSVSYSVSGIRLIVPNNSTLGTPESLINKKIAVIPNNVNQKAIAITQPQAQLVPFNTLEEGLNALKEGKVDAVAGDGILLDGLRQQMDLANVKIVPESPYASYGISCMVGQHDPTFLRLINYTIVKLMEGYLAGDKEAVAIINRWVGKDGVVNIDEKAIRDFFNFTLITHEQIPDDL